MSLHEVSGKPHDLPGIWLLHHFGASYAEISLLVHCMVAMCPAGESMHLLLGSSQFGDHWVPWPRYVRVWRPNSQRVVFIPLSWKASGQHVTMVYPLCSNLPMWRLGWDQSPHALQQDILSDQRAVMKTTNFKFNLKLKCYAGGEKVYWGLEGLRVNRPSWRLWQLREALTISVCTSLPRIPTELLTSVETTWACSLTLSRWSESDFPPLPCSDLPPCNFGQTFIPVGRWG